MSMNPRLLRPTASGFDPRRIANLAVWLDFADLSSLGQNSDGSTAVTATNDPIGYVRDKSGNGRHFTQSDNNSRPLLSVGAQNGRPAAVFDGSNDSLLGNAAALSIARNVGGLSAFCVRKPDVTNVQLGYFVISNGTTGGARFALSMTGSPTFNRSVNIRRADGDSLTFINQTLPESTNAAIYYGDCNYAAGGAGALRLLVNGSVLATTSVSGTGNTSNTDSLAVSVGSTLGTSLFFDGNMFEVIAYQRVLSAAERQAVERYLSAKWGI